MPDNRHMDIPSGVNAIDKELVKKKKKYEHFAIEYNKMLGNKILPKNKSAPQSNMETGLVEELLKATVELDEANFNEGIYGLLVLSMRIGLFMRDKVNILEDELKNVREDVSLLNKKLQDLSRAKDGQ